MIKADDDSIEDASDDEGEDMTIVVAMTTEAVMMVAVTKAIKRVRLARTLSRLLPGRPIDIRSIDFSCA